MLLATRCPFCETVFRLQAAQLAQHRGLVRCGQCHEIFDASGSLFDVSNGGDFASAKPVAAAAVLGASSAERAKSATFDENTARPAAASSEPLARSAGAEPVLADAPLEPFAYVPDEAPTLNDAPQVWHKTARPAAAEVDTAAPLHRIPDDEVGVGTAGLGATAASFTAAPAANAAANTAADTAASTAATDSPSPGGPRGAGGPPPSSGEPFSVNPVNDGSDPFRVTREPRPVEGRRVGWAIAAIVVGLVLIVGLLAQLAWWQRETVQVYFPASQALYVKACARLGCQVTPPHDIDGLQVEPSDLRQVDGPHKLELKMPLHNRFNIALAYPAIELTLLDDQNNVAVRRVLWPQDYVPPGTPIAAGLPAHTTQTMIVHLDTGMAIASNFRVQIFYP